MSRILLLNGTLIDGTGAPPELGSLLIIDDRIAELGCFLLPEDAVRIDCTGLTISPGFVDAHSHSDLQVLENRREKVKQGVTTEVVGNCGFSPYPTPPNGKLLQDYANWIFCGEEGWGWVSAKDYFQAVLQTTTVANVASLVGHGSLRVSRAGNKLGPLSARDLDEMEQQLDESLSQGAAGFSTGLMYVPGSSAPFEELERLCRVVARHNKVYATHMRSYSSDLLAAIDEQIDLAKRTGCKLQISHLQAAGRRNWASQSVALEKIERARGEGFDIAFDCYPYTAGSTTLTQLLPEWALDGGLDALLERLSDRSQQVRIAAEIGPPLKDRWTDIFVSAVGSRDDSVVGKNIATIAEMRGMEPSEVVLDLLRDERGAIQIISFNQSEENLRQLLTHPLAIIVSDGFYVKGRPHPRLHGTFPLLLGRICREREWLPLTEAIHKITDVPARRFGLAKRGRLTQGFFADIAVFDACIIQSDATYEHPEVDPFGICYVFRNGRLVAQT